MSKITIMGLVTFSRKYSGKQEGQAAQVKVSVRDMADGFQYGAFVPLDHPLALADVGADIVSLTASLQEREGFRNLTNIEDVAFYQLVRSAS